MAVNHSIPTWSTVSFVKDHVRRLLASESRRELAVSISSLAGSGLASVAIRFVGGIILGRYVSPDILGYYASFTIVPAYLYLLHFGVFTALSRQYPYYIGKGNRTQAIAYASNALGWTRVLSVLQATGFLIPAIYAAVHGHWMAAFGWGSQVVLSFTDRYMMYLGSTYRSSAEFAVWSKTSVIAAFVSLLVLPIVAFYAYAGVCLRAVVPNVVSLWYAHRHRPLRIRATFQRHILVQMIAFGAPLMLIGYVGSYLWDAVSSTYILTFLDKRQLGIMTFSVTFCIALTTVAVSISQVFLPRIAALYGSSGNSMAAGFRYCVRAAVCGAAVVLPLVMLASWLIGPFVRLFLPAYVDCIPVVRVLCWLALVPVLELPRQLLVVAKLNWDFGLSILPGFALFGGLLLLSRLLRRPLDLSSLVTLSVACKFGTVVLGDLLVWRRARQELRESGTH